MLFEWGKQFSATELAPVSPSMYAAQRRLDGSRKRHEMGQVFGGAQKPHQRNPRNFDNIICRSNRPKRTGGRVANGCVCGMLDVVCGFGRKHIVAFCQKCTRRCGPRPGRLLWRRNGWCEVNRPRQYSLLAYNFAQTRGRFGLVGKTPSCYMEMYFAASYGFESMACRMLAVKLSDRIATTSRCIRAVAS